jgi:hypothetical protein
MRTLQWGCTSTYSKYYKPAFHQPRLNPHILNTYQYSSFFYNAPHFFVCVEKRRREADRLWKTTICLFYTDTQARDTVQAHSHHSYQGLFWRTQGIRCSVLILKEDQERRYVNRLNEFWKRAKEDRAMIAMETNFEVQIMKYIEEARREEVRAVYIHWRRDARAQSLGNWGVSVTYWQCDAFEPSHLISRIYIPSI